jgi:hypothetical protein
MQVLCQHVREILTERNVRNSLSNGDIEGVIKQFKDNHPEHYREGSVFLINLENMVHKADEAVLKDIDGVLLTNQERRVMILDLLQKDHGFLFRYRFGFVNNVLDKALSMRRQDSDVEIVADFDGAFKDALVARYNDVFQENPIHDQCMDAVMEWYLLQYPTMQVEQDVIRHALEVWVDSTSKPREIIKFKNILVAKFNKISKGSDLPFDQRIDSVMEWYRKNYPAINAQVDGVRPSLINWVGGPGTPLTREDRKPHAVPPVGGQGTAPPGVPLAREDSNPPDVQPVGGQGTPPPGVGKNAVPVTVSSKKKKTGPPKGKQKSAIEIPHFGINPADKLELTDVAKDVVSLFNSGLAKFDRGDIQVLTIGSKCREVYEALSTVNSEKYGTSKGCHHDIIVYIIIVLFELMNKSDCQKSATKSIGKTGRFHQYWFMKPEFYRGLNIPMVPLSPNAWNKVLRKYVREKGLDQAVTEQNSKGPYYLDDTLMKCFNRGRSCNVLNWPTMLHLMHKNFLKAHYHAWDVPEKYHTLYDLQPTLKYKRFLLEDLLTKMDCYFRKEGMMFSGDPSLHLGESYKKLMDVPLQKDWVYMGKYVMFGDMFRRGHITYVEHPVEVEEKQKERDAKKLADAKKKAEKKISQSLNQKKTRMQKTKTMIEMRKTRMLVMTQQAVVPQQTPVVRTLVHLQEAPGPPVSPQLVVATHHVTVRKVLLPMVMTMRQVPPPMVPIWEPHQQAVVQTLM